MTDQDAYTLAGWIERARKAEAALTRYGYVLFSNGEWVLSDASIARMAPKQAATSGPRVQCFTPGLPPIDYDTKS